MAYQSFVPKIQWLEDTFTGTIAIGSDTITAIADTSAIQVGMFVEEAGIPTGTTVLSKTASTVVMSADATAAGAVSISRGFRLEFDLPPAKDPLSEKLKFNGRSLVAKAGAVQTNEDFIQKNNNPAFSHVSQVIKDSFENFLITHAFARRSFSYFEDKLEPTSKLTVSTDIRFTDPGFKIMSRKGGGKNFLWKFKLEMRRVL